MYLMNNIEHKVYDYYHSGSVEQAINYTKLVSYNTPILVDIKLQSEWLDVDTLCDLCGVDVGEKYNKDIPWLFLIHGDELKIMPLAPLVHSISYEMLAKRNLATYVWYGTNPLNDLGNFVTNKQSTTINAYGNSYLVTLLNKDKTSPSESRKIYDYILSPRISEFIDSLYDCFEVDYMRDYTNIRREDMVWCDNNHFKSNHHRPYQFSIVPHEFMSWEVTNAMMAGSMYNSNGNEMAWLPVLRLVS